MSFASPNVLYVLLILLPIVWYIGFPRLAYRRRRDIASLILRSTLMTLIVLALAGLQIVRDVERMAVVFLVDASDSMGAELQQAQLDYIREAVATKPPDDEWALVVFGADVSIDTPFNTVSDVPPIRSTVLGSNTNIADGVQTAISLFPADARRRVVILSDGQETIGDAEAKARLAEASGVEISYVLLQREPEPDVRITNLVSPPRVAEGQEFDIEITIASDVATEATLLFFSGNQLISEQDITIPEGGDSWIFTRESPASGFLNFSAQVVVPNANDGYVQNNQLGTFSQVVGQPRVLMVAEEDIDTEHLLPALRDAGVQVDLVRPTNLPPDTGSLAVYESVIIVNVPATSLSTRQMERLQTYVRDLGGGLVFIGGPESFGPGGYYQTAMEETLPIETQIRDQQRLPQLTIAYLVDSSGSMGASYDGDFSNLQLAQRAISLSIDFLQPTDRAAVITFDSAGSLVAEFQDVNDGERLKQLTGTLRPGGGTNIEAGMETAQRYIVTEPSEIKHLVLITDGGAAPSGLVRLTEQLNEQNNVTLSTIAIGSSIPPFLREMAEAGQGNYHQVENVGQIPNILAQETVLATRSYIEEGDFSAVRTAINPMTDGIGAIPNFNGYVATTEKDTAQVVLRAPAPNNDPLLVSWQYGLGRAIVFTGDATSRWSTNWVNWSNFPRFWGQVVNYSITDNTGNNIESQIVMEGEFARIVIDARTDEGAFLNNLGMQTRVIAPDNTSRTVRLQQTAPGRYEGTFLPSTEGSYFLGIDAVGVGSEGETIQFNEVTGWVMSYSPEYAQNEANEPLLRNLADITGGQSLADTPDEAFAMTDTPRTAVAPIAPLLLLLAILLLPFDIAVRRLIITRSDIQRLRAYLFGGGDIGAHEDRMSSLFTARQRARERTQAGESGSVAALRRAKSYTDAPEDDDPAPSSPQMPSAPRPSVERQAKRTNDGDNTVSSLLKRRRDNRDD